MGYIHFQTGEFERTIAIQKQIIAIMQETDTVADEATLHLNMADVLRQMGRIDEAIAHAEQGRALLVKYDLPQAAGGVTLAHYDELLAQLRGETPPAPSTLPAETVQQLADNTIAVMTSHTDKRDEWRAQLRSLIQQAKENNDSEIQAFGLALLAVTEGRALSLLRDIPYADVLSQVIAAIASHNQGGGS